jgi:hypothetical protein
MRALRAAQRISYVHVGRRYVCRCRTTPRERPGDGYLPSTQSVTHSNNRTLTEPVLNGILKLTQFRKSAGIHSLRHRR